MTSRESWRFGVNVSCLEHQIMALVCMWDCAPLSPHKISVPMFCASQFFSHCSL